MRWFRRILRRLPGEPKAPPDAAQVDPDLAVAQRRAADTERRLRRLQLEVATIGRQHDYRDD